MSTHNICFHGENKKNINYQYFLAEKCVIWFYNQTVGPDHVKTCLRAYTDSEGPDQPAHPRSLIKGFTVR